VTNTLFISDLHLSDERPEITALFLHFLHNAAAKTQALYILGDLFEVWLGDDAVLPAYQPVLEGLRTLTGSGVPVYVMHGNRDFLMGGLFARQSGCRLIPDPTIIDLNGERTLLMHGDTLCSDDLEYQRFRIQVRDPETRKQFLGLPIEQRIAVAKHYREQSRIRTRDKAEEIMDVNQQTVANTMREYGVRRLIHGHTHRPAIHCFCLDDRPARRMVLGDWYEQGSMLICDSAGCQLKTVNAAETLHH
jgi:UDP-2,3-diacylglucosamine hydrolase